MKNTERPNQLSVKKSIDFFGLLSNETVEIGLNIVKQNARLTNVVS